MLVFSSTTINSVLHLHTVISRRNLVYLVDNYKLISMIIVAVGECGLCLMFMPVYEW